MSWIKSTEFLIKDLVFALLKIFLRKGRPEMIPIDLKNIRKILFLRHDKIGDLVISLPVFDNLKRLYPHLEFSIMCSPTNVGLIKDDPRFKSVYLYRKNIFKDIMEVRRIRKKKYDCVVDLINSDSTSGLFLTQLTVGQSARIGVQKKKFADRYDFCYFHEQSDLRHIIRNTLVVLEAFGIDTADCKPVAAPYLNKSNRDQAEKFISQTNEALGESGNVDLVGVNLSVGQKTRLWSIENYVALIKKIIEESHENIAVIIFTAPVDRSRGDELASHFDGKVVVQIPTGLSLLGATALLSKLKLFISPDTSMVHIARSFEVPVVGLYPKPLVNFLQWHPFDQKEGAVMAESLSNIYDIPVELVFNTYANVIAAAGESQ